MNIATQRMIDRNLYTELDLLLWDYGRRLIPEKTAFEIYEKRWKYVDQNKITPTEKQLIQNLTQVYGKGLFLAA